MSKRVTIAVIAAATSLTSFSAAKAADLPVEQEYIIEEPVVEYQPSAYYVRADCAYAFNQTPDMIVGSRREHFVQKNGGHIEIENNWACGVGLGTHFAHNFRIDATVEWRSAFEIEGVRDPSVAGSLGQKTKIQSTVGLVNLYYDIGHYGGLTPYVGVGAGIAQNKMENVLVPSSGFETFGSTKTSFAWALMAGASYDLGDRWAIDAGYRYINFGDATSGVWGNDGSAVPAIETADMSAHEIRVGLRYDLW